MLLIAFKKAAGLATLIVLIFLGSCTQFAPKTPVSTSNSLPTNWLSSGKLAIKLPATTGSTQKKTQVLRFKWQHEKAAFSLRLSGAFGLGAVTVNQETNKQVSLLRGGKVIGRAKDAETLLFQHTGLSLPISLLQYWIIGQPDNSAPFSMIEGANPHSALHSFEQQGWQINYTDTAVTGSYLLPKKISATNGEIALKAIISQWDLIN